MNYIARYDALQQEVGYIKSLKSSNYHKEQIMPILMQKQYSKDDAELLIFISDLKYFPKKTQFIGITMLKNMAIFGIILFAIIIAIIVWAMSLPALAQVKQSLIMPIFISVLFMLTGIAITLWNKKIILFLFKLGDKTRKD